MPFGIGRAWVPVDSRRASCFRYALMSELVAGERGALPRRPTGLAVLGGARLLCASLQRPATRRAVQPAMGVRVQR